MADALLLERAAEKLATLREGLVASYRACSERPQVVPRSPHCAQPPPPAHGLDPCTQAQREAAEELVASYRARSLKRPQVVPRSPHCPPPPPPAHGLDPCTQAQPSASSEPPAKRSGHHQRTETAAAELLRLEAEADCGSLGEDDRRKLAKMQSHAQRSQLKKQRADEAHEKAVTRAINNCPAFWNGRRYQYDTAIPGTDGDTPRKRVLRLRDERRARSLPFSAAKLLAADPTLEKVTAPRA